MQFIDWSIIVLYLVGVIFLGFWVGRGQRSARDYFLGNQSISWWSVALSIVATETSALTFIGVPAMSYGGDMTFIQIVIGYVLARFVLAVLFVPHYFKGEIYSPYQLLTKSFGSAAGRTCAGIFLLAGTLAAGVRVYVTSIPLHLMTNISITSSVILFIVLSLVYMYMGGIKSVIWTEVFQFFLFVGGGIFTLFYVPHLLSGSFGENWQMASEAGKTHWLNWKWGWNMPFNIWMGVIGAMVQVLSSHGADQLIVQRVLTCRNMNDGRKALILSGILIFPLFLIFLLCGIFLWMFYQQNSLQQALPDGKVDYIFPLFILSEMPVGLRGFLIVAIFAAAMSSVASALSALSSVSVMDFIKPRLKQTEDLDKRCMRLGKFSTVFWAVLLIVVAKLSEHQPLVLNWAFSLNGLTSGAMLGGLGLALYGAGLNGKAVIVGMCVSVVGMIAMQVAQLNIFAWPWFTLIGCFLTLIVTWLLNSILKKN